MNYLLDLLDCFTSSKLLAVTDVLIISPFIHAHQPSCNKIRHHQVGVDVKFNLGQVKTEGDFILEYDLEQGIQKTIDYINDFFEKREIACVMMDCQTFASHLMPGVPTPFPFGVSSTDSCLLIKTLQRHSRKIRLFGICGFNPAIEERRSVSFLTDFLWKVFFN